MEDHTRLLTGEMTCCMLASTLVASRSGPVGSERDPCELRRLAL